MASEPRNLRISLPEILDVMGMGVRRASSFMSLGLHASSDETVSDLHLDANFQIQFMPRELPIESVRRTQQDFEHWIIGNGLRELDQFASIFADRVYRARSLVEFNDVPLPGEVVGRIREFEGLTNVAQKFGRLNEQFQINSGLSAHLNGLSNARNALTHNMGIVGRRHCNQANELKITWRGFEIVVGEMVIHGGFEPIQVQEGELITAQYVNRETTFPLGTSIQLSPHDLHEICLTYQFHAQQVIQQLQQQLQQLGLIQSE